MDCREGGKGLDIRGRNILKVFEYKRISTNAWHTTRPSRGTDGQVRLSCSNGRRKKTLKTVSLIRTFRFNTLTLEKQCGFFFAKVYGGSGLWRNICKLMMKGFLLMLVLNKRQDTNAEKNVVFIVFYSLYFVYYYVLKYLLFTIVAPFGKDIFFSQSAWTSTAFFFWVVVCVWGGGEGGGKRCWGFPLVVEYRGHKKTGHNEDKQKQSEQVEERSRVILAVVSPIPDWLFFFLTTFRVGLCGWWGRGGNMKRVLGTCKF